MQKKIKASEDKIKKIKARKEQPQDSKLELEQAIVTVIKEFHFSMDDVMQMNVFTLLWYYTYALRYNNYRVETIAFGNGLIKKHKYFSE